MFTQNTASASVPDQKFLLNPPAKHAVFAGGVVLGIFLLGVIKALQEHGMDKHLDSIAASSIGSLMGLILALGLKAEDVIPLLVNKTVDLEKFIDPVSDFFSYRDPNEPHLVAHFKAFYKPALFFINYFKNGGAWKGDYIRETVQFIIDLCLKNNVPLLKKIEKALESKDESTYKSLTEIRDIIKGTSQQKLNLQHLHHLKILTPELGFKDLFVTGTKATVRGIKNEVFSHQTNPPVAIEDAIRASMSIPFLYKPVVINNKYYADGGLTSNLPYEVYKNNPDTKKDPLLCVDFGRPYPDPTLSENENAEFLFLNTLKISPLNFNLNEKEITTMIESAYKQTIEHLRKQKYIPEVLKNPNITPFSPK